MTKFLAAATVAVLLIGTSGAMAADSAGGNGAQGSTGTTANAPSQPDGSMKAPAPNGAMNGTTGMNSSNGMNNAPMIKGAEGNASGGAGNDKKATDKANGK